MQTQATIAQYVADTVPKFLERVEITKHAIILWTDHARLLNLMLFLRDDASCAFKQLVELTSIDYPEEMNRFEMVYHLLSLRFNMRLVVKLKTTENQNVPSVTSLFRCANWMERETWDMFGIKFEGHPDLRRLLTDYGFEGHPLRKDFPLTGFVEMRYDDTEKRVVYEPVSLRQDFRVFDFESPWEGMAHNVLKNVLPGDEKATYDLPLKKESA
ncbi:MAG: NADH-quinone oxidoreductase subunit C [Alphaproteobacteria bacterium]|nr:NADH-quinone oxidoreductase subunit C [Alphaproteobacteria bacterium]